MHTYPVKEDTTQEAEKYMSVCSGCACFPMNRTIVSENRFSYNHKKGVVLYLQTPVAPKTAMKPALEFFAETIHYLAVEY